MSFLSKAIVNLRPNSAWKIVGDATYENIEWLSTDQTMPTKEELEAEKERLLLEYRSQQYARDRADEYPSIGDQLDMIFKSGVLDGSDWAAVIQEIKDKYPKPEANQ